MDDTIPECIANGSVRFLHSRWANEEECWLLVYLLFISFSGVSYMFCVVSVEDVQFGFIRNVPNVIEICLDKQLWNFYRVLCVCLGSTCSDNV